MGTANERAAAVFDEIADLLEIGDANPFRIRAYRNAARTLRGSGRDVGDMLVAGEDLTTIPGIGRELAAKIREIVDTGSARALDKLRREVPRGLEDLLKIPGLGPKRVRAIHRGLGVRDLGGLENAVRGGRLRGLGGFGARTEQRILEAIGARSGEARRYPRDEAARIADALAGWLREAPGVREVVVAGSFRRGRESVGDLDLLVAGSGAAAVMDRFVSFAEVANVLAKGPTRSTVLLHGGLQVDLRVVEPESFGAALHYFTGSRAHNIAIRRLGQQRGLKINEYGVFRGTRRTAGATEESVFAAVGLPYIPPELRENAGEIEAAQAVRLPKLIELRDLRGDLRVRIGARTTGDQVKALLAAAARRRLRYLALTLPAAGPAIAGGLAARALEQRRRWLAQVIADCAAPRALIAVEVEIEEDGRLVLDERLRGAFDFTVGVATAAADLPRRRQTARLVRAMTEGMALLAHPLGRLLGEREPIAVDMPALLHAAREHSCVLELAGDPRRLDLPDIYCRMCREAGVAVAVNSTGAQPGEFDNLAYGILQARRGWLEPADVLNTRAAGGIERWLRARAAVRR